MKITICGSMHHIAGMQAAATTLEDLGYEVHLPNPNKTNVDYSALKDNERAALRDKLTKNHLNKIKESDMILVYNEDKNGVTGYVGGSTLMEMAFAYAQGIEIFMFKPVPDISYSDEILGMQPTMLSGDISAIDTYISKLPKLYVSSKSPVKLAAVSRGLRRAGIRTHVFAHPTQSGVNEQPMTINEAYEGAMNRHKALKQATSDENPTYLATVESGLHAAHDNHNLFGSVVMILEKVGSAPKVGINLDLEFPKEMTDKVPSRYPDIGVLVQQEYGATLKDSYPFFTGGKLTRQHLLEESAFNLAVQLDNPIATK